MAKLFRALKAENIKLFSKLSSKMFILAALLLSVAIAVCVQSVSQNDSLPAFFDSGHASFVNTEYVPSEEWIADGERQISVWIARMDELTEVINNKSGHEKANAEKEYDRLLRNASVMRYRIDNGIKPTDSSGWDKAVFVFWLTAFALAPLYLVCVSDIFAGEYTRGTLRTILPRPVTRIKQYTAKLMLSFVYAALLLTVALVGSVVSCAVVCGGLGDTRYIGWLSGGVLDCGRGTLMVMLLVCVLASYMIIAALCAAVGMLTRSRAASGTVSFTVFAVSWLLGEAVCANGGVVAAMSIFSVLDISTPLLHTPHSAAFGFNTIVVCAAAYFALFSFLGYSFFKKDV